MLPFLKPSEGREDVTIQVEEWVCPVATVVGGIVAGDAGVGQGLRGPQVGARKKPTVSQEVLLRSEVREESTTPVLSLRKTGLKMDVRSRIKVNGLGE